MSNPTFWSWADRLRIRVHDGGITPVKAHSDTGWRSLPYTMITIPRRLGRRPMRGFTCQTRDDAAHYKEGVALVMPPYREHRLFDNGCDHVSVWTHIHLVLEPNLDLLSFFALPLFYRGAAVKRLEELVRTLIADGGDDVLAACRFRRAGFALFELLLEAAEPRETFFSFQREYHDFLPLLHHIQERRDRRLSVAALAAWRRVSPSKLQKDFRRVFGMPLGAFLLRERLNLAARLMRERGMNNAEAARATGFADAFAFGKAFKKHFGLTPSRYRRQAWYHPE